MMIEVHGRAAHSSTPWLGDNAVLKAIDVFRAIESLPFSRQSSEVFDRPSINLGRIEGGDAINKVPDRCRMAVDIRFLPGQDPDEIMGQIGRIGEAQITKHFIFPPVSVPRSNPYVRALRDAVARAIPDQEVMSVGRDGASDAVAFMAAGIPAVEFGPDGAGHHGPEEWVSISSMARYRRSLVSFVRMLPIWLERPAPEVPAGDGGAVAADEPRSGLTAIEGGRG
jgi:succinyl-diaminopimelate desuccinylase